MKGMLELNLFPTYMCFVCVKNNVRQCRYCDKSEIHDLLVDLNLLAPHEVIASEEYMLRLPGDYSLHVLTKYGLFKACDLKPVCSCEELSAKRFNRMNSSEYKRLRHGRQGGRHAVFGLMAEAGT